jgi:hypothetical protein
VLEEGHATESPSPSSHHRAKTQERRRSGARLCSPKPSPERRVSPRTPEPSMASRKSTTVRDSASALGLSAAVRCSASPPLFSLSACPLPAARERMRTTKSFRATAGHVAKQQNDSRGKELAFQTTTDVSFPTSLDSYIFPLVFP